jgi:hypothetical protein
VDDGEHLDAIRFDAVNDAIGLFDELADIFRVIFGHFAAGKGVVGDLFGAASDAVHHPAGIGRRV